MTLDGKYIWIWELNRCYNGNVDLLIRNAKDLGVDGYIVKTHDGSNFWHQSYAIPELKNAGLKVGAWGYCYGKNVKGEISAIKTALTFNPDFYVFDIEIEFEAPNMDSVAEQILSQLQDSNVPLGYSSFAIPDYHPIPYEVFSRYCQFTMPQVYWAEMEWQLNRAFETSYSQYGKYNLPIYPVGQITSDVPAQEIIDFTKLCRNKNIPVISYWDCQSTTDTQLNALKQSNKDELNDALNVLVGNGIINTPDYWLENSTYGNTIQGEYARLLILKTAKKLSAKA